MSFQGNKIRQLWLPLLITALIILALSWILSGVIYPNNVQGNDEFIETPNQVTTTASPTVTSTRTPLPTQTRSVDENTPSATAIYNCTYSLHYWRNNPDSWMIENIVIGNLSFSKAEAIIILDIEFPNPSTRMVQQFFAALLNTLKGADPADIDQTMVAVGEWLTIHPPGIDLTEAEIIKVDAMAEVLEAHNTGLTGPGHCVDEPFTPTPEATFTPTATRTSTPAPVRTSPPRTPTPTKKSSGSKPKPTKPPETSPPSQPTSTPKPQPTNPPQPQPTNTPKPRSTPTPAPPPTSSP
jgi:hypothetical protein